MCLEGADSGELSAVCLLDQSAAYDLLCHKGIKEKLHIYNFSDSSIDWLMSYLGGRTQLVQVESRTSSQLDCGDSGVPQGSVLGGLLHVINSNDFPACHEEGESVVYVDDDSDCVRDKEQGALKGKIEKEAGNSAQWLKDNRLCVAGEKSKLLILGTSEMKRSRITNSEVKIVVDGKEIVESSSEKLLGVVINNQLSWKNHLYGDKDNMGLIPQLSKRLGMLKRLAKYMGKDKLKYFSVGIFYSKLSYCLPVFGNIFGLDNYKEENRRYFSFTTKDNNNLQVLQNKLNKLLLNADYNTSTADLLHQTGSLSVHQMVAYQTAVATYKIVKSGKPKYIAEKMQARQMKLNIRQGGGTVKLPGYTLNIAREGFIYRGASLFNKLDVSLRKEPKLEKFKVGVKEWVKQNVTIKPKSNFSSIEAGSKRNIPPPPPKPPPKPPPNSIRNYFHPVTPSLPTLSLPCVPCQPATPPTHPSTTPVPIPGSSSDTETQEQLSRHGSLPDQ